MSSHDYTNNDLYVGCVLKMYKLHASTLKTSSVIHKQALNTCINPNALPECDVNF